MSQQANNSTLTSPLLLKQCEAIVEGELENLQKLFRALELIQEQELYKDQYEDFMSYYQSRWNINGALELQGEHIFKFKIKDKNELPKLS